MAATTTIVFPMGAMATRANRPRGVQHGGRDGADRVEQHLRDEEPEEVGRELLLLGGHGGVGHARREELRELRGEGDPEHRHEPEPDERDREDAARDLLHPAILAAAEVGHEGRDQDG